MPLTIIKPQGVSIMTETLDSLYELYGPSAFVTSLTHGSISVRPYFYNSTICRTKIQLHHSLRQRCGKSDTVIVTFYDSELKGVSAHDVPPFVIHTKYGVVYDTYDIEGKFTPDKLREILNSSNEYEDQRQSIMHLLDTFTKNALDDDYLAVVDSQGNVHYAGGDNHTNIVIDGVWYSRDVTAQKSSVCCTSCGKGLSSYERKEAMCFSCFDDVWKPKAEKYLEGKEFENLYAPPQKTVGKYPPAIIPQTRTAYSTPYHTQSRKVYTKVKPIEITYVI